MNTGKQYVIALGVLLAALLVGCKTPVDAANTHEVYVYNVSAAAPKADSSLEFIKVAADGRLFMRYTTAKVFILTGMPGECLGCDSGRTAYRVVTTSYTAQTAVLTYPKTTEEKPL